MAARRRASAAAIGSCGAGAPLVLGAPLLALFFLPDCFAVFFFAIGRGLYSPRGRDQRSAAQGVRRARVSRGARTARARRARALRRRRRPRRRRALRARRALAR